jgi:hypothetical protein
MVLSFILQADIYTTLSRGLETRNSVLYSRLNCGTGRKTDNDAPRYGVDLRKAAEGGRCSIVGKKNSFNFILRVLKILVVVLLVIGRYCE